MNPLLRLGFCALLALSISACATGKEPAIRTVTVNVPVPVPCPAIEQLGPEPAYPDTDEALRAAPDIFGRVRLLVAGRLQRIARDAEKTAALEACR